MRKRVYIAGPISKGDLFHNIKQAEVAFFRLLKTGFAPFCPHWSCYSNGPVRQVDGSVTATATAFGGGGCDHADWLGVDLEWVAASDIVLRLPGESRGADLETELADRLGIPVYHDVEQVIKEHGK